MSEKSLEYLVHDIWRATFLILWLAELEVYGCMNIIFIGDAMSNVAYFVAVTCGPWAINLHRRYGQLFIMLERKHAYFMHSHSLQTLFKLTFQILEVFDTQS